MSGDSARVVIPLRTRVPVEVVAIALVLALLIVWIHLPIFYQGGFIGAPGTDVLRGAWGLDHAARGLPLPFWTSRLGFPEGVKILVLPALSSILGAPLTLLGPALGYDAWVLVMSWASALAVALFVREVSGTSAGGLLAGAVTAVQPMHLLAITDGTPELVAFWGVPAALWLTWRARAADRAAWGLGAGLAWAGVALDSPYHAVFSVPFVLVVLPGFNRRNLARFVAGLGVGLGAVVLAYWGLPVGHGEVERRGGNAVQLAVWWQWESGQVRSRWDYTLAPGFTPLAVLAGGFALAALRPRRAWPWAAVALLCLGLALGGGEDNPAWATRYLGSPAGRAFDAISSFNEALPVPVVRFPRRWLVPAAFALATAAGIGIGAVPRAWARGLLAVPLAALAVEHTLRLTGYREGFQRFPEPRAAFVDFVRERPGGAGALLILPNIPRASTIAERREDVPAFAGLDATVGSADHAWIQLATGLPSVWLPDGLRTMVPRTARSHANEKLLRDLDDLTNPVATGRPVPPSATMEPEKRSAAATGLVTAGLRYVVIDEAAYGEELAAAKVPFAEHLLEERRFDDGTGVTVWVLRP